MPLSINVGLSRKASKDYQSTGVSINVTAELDQSLLAKPEQLQKQIDDLYRQAESAIQRQVQAQSGPDRAAEPSRRERPQHERQPRPNRDRDNGRDNRRNGAGITASQKRAISAIADRLGVNPDDEAKELFRSDVDRLSIREASGLIDHLKELQTAGNGSNGHGR